MIPISCKPACHCNNCQARLNERFAWITAQNWTSSDYARLANELVDEGFTIADFARIENREDIDDGN
jgi:hypothetical protein